MAEQPFRGQAVQITGSSRGIAVRTDWRDQGAVAALGYLPEVGERIDCQGFEFEATAAVSSRSGCAAPSRPAWNRTTADPR